MRRWQMYALALSLSCGTVAHAEPPRPSPSPDGERKGESVAGRRAVRGSALDGATESPELRTLREFEETSFMQAAETAVLGQTRDKESPPPGLVPGVELKLPDLPVRFDSRVVRYLEFYKSDKRGRAIMASWLRAQGRWRGLIEDALRRARLPLALLYVSMIESGYDPHDRSHAGAVGLWQFMPEGGKIYGLRIDFWVDERKNPEKSTEAVTRYLGDLKERFGAWPLALAAFNAGYGAVLRAMQKYNTNDYWELCKHEDGLPWDTLLYVPKVMATAVVGENRKAFGYDDLPTERGYAYDRVPVTSSTSLALIAKAAGVAPAEIETLNPELRRKRTPPPTEGKDDARDARWEVRVPKGLGARTLAALPSHPDAVRPFVVRFGDRIEEMAREHGIPARELKAMNGIDDTAEVRPGLTLVVPEAKPATPPPCEPPRPSSSPCGEWKDETLIVAVPDKEAVVAGKKRIFYRTLPQESPQDIAAFFKVKPAELARWNAVDLEAKLASNMVLQLWVPKELDTSKAALVDPQSVRVVTTGSDEFFDLVEAKRGRVRLAYTVKKGEDLAKIGKRYGLTVADLERINRFGEKHSAVQVGQKLTVYRAMTPAEKQKAACKLTPGGGDIVVADPPEADPALSPPAPPAPASDAAHVRLPRPPPPDPNP